MNSFYIPPFDGQTSYLSVEEGCLVSKKISFFEKKFLQIQSCFKPNQSDLMKVVHLINQETFKIEWQDLTCSKERNELMIRLIILKNKITKYYNHRPFLDLEIFTQVNKKLECMIKILEESPKT